MIGKPESHGKTRNRYRPQRAHCLPPAPTCFSRAASIAHTPQPVWRCRPRATQRGSLQKCRDGTRWPIRAAAVAGLLHCSPATARKHAAMLEPTLLGRGRSIHPSKRPTNQPDKWRHYAYASTSAMLFQRGWSVVCTGCAVQLRTCAKDGNILTIRDSRGVAVVGHQTWGGRWTGRPTVT